MWIFLSTKSTKSAYLNLVLEFYLRFPTDTLPRLRAAMGNTANRVSLLSASDAWSTFDVHTFAGYERLNPSKVGSSEDAAVRPVPNLGTISSPYSSPQSRAQLEVQN